MRRRTTTKLWVCTGGVLLAASAGQLHAQLAVTGSLTTTAVNYGSPAPGTAALATQTINTSFGDNTSSTGHLNGSELDAAYGTVEGGYLYLFIAGNIQDNGNPIDIWIDDGRPGQTTLAAPTGAGNMHNENGSIFSSGFQATYALELNTTDVTPNTNGNFFVDQYTLTGTPNATFLGQFGLTGGIGTSKEAGSTESAILVGVNNTNTGGVVGDSNGGADIPANAQSVATGIELGIPLATLGNPTGNIEVLAGINGNGDSGFCNQFLPGLEAGTPSIKKGPNGATNPYYLTNTEFTFANTTNEFFTVPNAVISNGIWLPTGNGNWSTTTNCSNGVVPQNPGDTASFASATMAATVTLDISPSVGTLDFENANSYLLAANPGQTLTMDNGGPTATANINDFGGVHTISAPVILNSNTTVTCQNHGDEMIISGNITGVGGLTVSNSGTFNATFSALVMSGTNSYSGGTTILRGELQLDSAGALPVGTALTIDDPNPHGCLDLNGFNATVSSLAATTGGSLPAQINNSNATAGNDSTFTYAGTAANPSTFPGTLSDNSLNSGGKLNLVIASGTLTLSNTSTNAATGADTYAGTTTVNSGATLILAAAGAVTNPANNPNGGNIQNNGSLIANDTLDTNTITAGNISGSGTTTVTSTTSLTVNNLNQAGGVVNNGVLTVLGAGPSVVGPISGEGTLQLAGPLQLATSSGLSTMSTLALAGAGTLDVNNNHVIINYGITGNGDPISQIQAMLLTGYAGGAWNGTGGIMSTAASLNSNHYGLGYADSADPGNPANLASGTLEIAYTLLGDVNLDGVVNAVDFGILAANFNKGVSGWDQGDFNYDNVVSAIDFGEMAANFNKGASGASVGGPAWTDPALVAFATANGLLADVPEPASIGLAAVAAVGLLKRQRRRCPTS